MEMEDSKPKRPFWTRRKFLINEHFQLHFIGFVGIVSLAACVLFYVASSYFFMTYHGYAVEVGLRPSDPFFRVLYNMEMMLTNIFVGTSVAVVLVSIVGGIIFSHRVAGPMYRLRRHCEAVSRGETVESVVFRKKDYFSDVADAYNAQMQYLRGHLDEEARQSAERAWRTTEAKIDTVTPVSIDGASQDVGENNQADEKLKKAG